MSKELPLMLNEYIESAIEFKVAKLSSPVYSSHIISYTCSFMVVQLFVYEALIALYLFNNYLAKVVL